MSPLRTDFASPPISMRPRPLWFWNDTTVRREGIREQMQMCLEAGYGGLGILPFGSDFSPSYLSDEYFALYGVALECARELGMTLSLYDEHGFPSGSVGARNSAATSAFAARHPGLLLKRLDKAERMASGPGLLEIRLPAAPPGAPPGVPPATIESVVAVNTVTLETLPLAGTGASAAASAAVEIVRDPAGGAVVRWDAPPGIWQLMVFSCVTDGEEICDYLDPEAGRAFIEMTHEAYYARFAEHFGTTIDSAFHDEPTLYRSGGRTWTHRFAEHFRELHGFDPAPLYPALWYDVGPRTAAMRNYLLSARTEFYARGFAGQIQAWSAEHGIAATGHQDQEEIENPASVSGDLIACFKYQEIPGIDKIGGDRPAERFYKVVSSAAYAYDRPFVMSETYGAMGDIGWDEIYRVALDQYTAGINMLIPHAVWYDDSRVVFRPELSPRNPLYAGSLRHFNDFLGRLNVLLQNAGRHVADVAILYPIDGLYAAHHFDGELGPYRGGVRVPESNYVEIAHLLSRRLGVDFRFLHPDVLDERGAARAGALEVAGTIHPGRFPLLILPAMRAIRPSTVAMVEELLAGGGHLIAVGDLPCASARFGDDEAPDRLRESIARHPNAQWIDWSPGGADDFPDDARATTLGAAIAAALPDPDVSITPAAGIGLIHKVHEGKSIYLVANLTDSHATVSLSLRGRMELEAWDPHTGRMEKAECRRGPDGRTHAALPLGPSRGAALVER